LDKEPEENKEMPEDPVDETTGEEKIQDKAEEAVEEQPEEEKIETEDTDEEPENIEERNEGTEKDTEEKPVKNKETKKPETAKLEEKKDTKPKKDDDFQYIVRLSNTDIDGDKNIVYGLNSIKGIGMHMASLIAEKAGIDRKLKMGKLSESQIKKLQDAIDSVTDYAPIWMLNHRKDYDTGEDIHLIGPEIDLKLRDEINIMKKIRSYRGIRHERGLPVRGQRTRANNRKGLSLGVSKKREQSK